LSTPRIGPRFEIRSGPHLARSWERGALETRSARRDPPGHLVTGAAVRPQDPSVLQVQCEFTTAADLLLSWRTPRAVRFSVPTEHIRARVMALVRSQRCLRP